MKYKEELLEILTTSEGISKKYNVSETILDNLKDLKEEITNFKVKVPIIGGFNAGKTSLINCFLHDDRLPTGITPETAIAAEIKFSEKERIVAHSKTGETKEFKIDELKEIKSSDYIYIEVFLNRPKINQYKDIVIVDMPGLDSKIEEHNQAILNYIGEGIYYIVAVDADHGIKDSILRFLNEINLYEIDFAVLVTKSDHKMPEDVEKVVSNVQRIVSSIAGKDVFTGTTSIKDSNIKDFINILDSIEYDKIISRKFNYRIIEQIDKLIRELEIRKKYRVIDTTEIKSKISEINKKIKELEMKVSEEELRIEEKFNAETVENIIRDVKYSLIDNMNWLVQSAKGGQDSFIKAVNEVIRPVLSQSVSKNVAPVLEVSFQNINMKLENMQNNLLNVYNVISTTQKTLTNVSKTVKNPKIRGIIAGLAIFTNVIAPWLEIIILLLPDIITLFINQERIIREQIETQVIPQIEGKLRPEILSTLSQIKNEFINEVKTEIEENKKALIDSLNNAKNEKNKAIEEFNQWKEEVDTDIEKLKKIKEQL